MSRMKHLLRKLHIGGGGGTSLNDPQRLPPDNPPESHSSSPSPSSSASPAAATPSARSRTPESSAPPAQPRRAIAAAPPSPAAAPAPAVDDQVDFNFFEEEFQVQLALAISVSDPDARGDPESAQIKAAKRISLGCAPSPNSTLVDFRSLRYWNYHFINYDEKVIDGFYDVHEVTSNPSLQGKLPSLADLQTMPVSDQVDYEVVLVNRALDHKLKQLELKAFLIASECRATQLGPAVCGLVQKIAALVADSMGGPVGDADDMSKRWLLKSQELRKALNTIVLPLGCLDIGMARHRALLFKVLADRINLPCRLVKGSYCTGTDEGAVNIVKVDHESEYIVDLMGAPGTLIPAEMPSSQLQSSGFEIMSSNNIEETVRDLYLALDKKVNFPFVNNQGTPVGISCNSDLDQKLVGSGSGDSSQTYLQQEDVMGLIENKQTAMSEDELMKPVPTLGRSGVSLLGMEEAASSAQEMKVKDVSKYVISAAQDPEFAQKLHAVLLESGASLPPDLFSDISSSQEVVEELVKGDSCIREEMKIPRVEPVDFGNHQECVPDVSVKNHGQDADVSFSFWRPECQKSIQNFCMGNPDSSSMGLRSPHSEQVQEQLIPCEPVAIQKPPANCFGVAAPCFQESGGSITKYIEAKGNISSLAGQEKNSESIAKIIEATSTNLHGANSNSESSNLMLDDVAEWEIPWEDLQIGERIGLGLYGEVYRADWNGTEVAVKKFLDQDVSGDALEQFRCEIRIMLRLRHPNVVLFMGAVTRPPNLSILTEFLPRGSLYKLLHRPAVQLDEKRRLRMALDVAKGMNYLHTSHPTIVHRDLKSPNLLVDKNWVVKVSDFGLSRLKHHTFLSSKSAAGTPEWMAPEVLRNEPSNEKCDVYSFGVILWELATLRMPWSGMNPMQVVGAVGFQNRRLEITSEVDPMVAQIIRDCWQSDPNLRPSFSQLLTPLKHLKHLNTEFT